MTRDEQLLSHLRFQLNVQHPGLEDCWLDGYAVGQTELDDDNNPYNSSTIEHEQWLQGWWAGFYNEAPLYNIEKQIDAISHVLTRAKVKQSANQAEWINPTAKKWALRTVSIGGAVAAALVAVEMLDLPLALLAAAE